MPERPENESLCKRCGACCYEKFILDDGVVLITDVPCPKLNLKDNTCSVYSNRLEANERCMSIEDAKEIGILPAGCPYVEGDPEYSPALFIKDYPEYYEILKEELDELESGS